MCETGIYIRRRNNGETLSAIKRMMRTTAIKIFRSFKGDKIRSKQIRQELGVQDVVRWIRERRSFWRDYVNRMPEERLAK